MDVVFLKLLNMSIAASWLILAVLILRLVLKRAPKCLTCILWAIVALRLICPFTLESSFSLIPSSEVLPQKVIAENTFQVDTGFSAIDYPVNEYLSDHYYEGVTVTAGHGNDIMTVLGCIWLVGLLMLLAYGSFSYIRLRRKVQEAVPFRENIYLCDAVSSPFILGLIRPRIYLSASIDEEQMKYVLAHEEAHLKRRDHWWKPLGYVLLTVYWFNPLIWAAYILLCRDIELACDEKVIKDMDIHGKKAYSSALVSCSMQRRMIVVCPLAFGEVSVKERVRTVLNYKKPAFWVIIAAVVMCIAAGVCFLTNPKKDTFNVRITIPAGGEDAFYYSDEEISPNGNRVTLSSGEGLGDTEVVLKPIEVKEENAYEPTYMTPGLPVKMDAEKGAWFKLGVSVQNPTDKDIVVYVRAKGVNVRIAEKNAVIPMVMIDDIYYYATGIESTRTNRSADMDGEITSSVSGTEKPQENNQSNFGFGYGYQYINDYAVEINWDGKWVIFEHRSDDSSKILYDGQWYDRRDLNDGTIRWLNWYNLLPAEEQLAINFVPPDLYELAGYGNGSDVPIETYDAYSEEDTITFIGVIVDNLLEPLVPYILVEPMGDEIPYEYVYFELPESEADWGMMINSVVSITCKNSFEETQPPIGELISIDRVGSSPIIIADEKFDLDKAISDAIIDKNSSPNPPTYSFECCDFITLAELSATPTAGNTTHTITYYGWALYEKYRIKESGITIVGGSHIPIALTFELDENGYNLIEYWEPRDGSYYVSDIRNKFPSDIADDAIDSQKFALQQKQRCYRQAIQFSGLDTDAVISNLLDTICSSPKESSNPQDYIGAHSTEYRELVFYGEYTLSYCFERFINGGETGLDGKIMAIVCEEILQTKGKLPEDADTAETGQIWYEKLLAYDQFIGTVY